MGNDMTMQDARPAVVRRASRRRIGREPSDVPAVEELDPAVEVEVEVDGVVAVVAHVKWASPAPGLWVASLRTRSGVEYAGTVEKTTVGYELRNGRGAAIGVFADADEARRALVRHVG